MTLNPNRLHAYLIAKRDFYGADSPIGHGCSNIVELFDNRRKAATLGQLAQIDANIAWQLNRLEKLCAEYEPVIEPPGTVSQ